MEFKIIERLRLIHKGKAEYRSKTIGQGFQSFNAVYLAVHAEISKRLATEEDVVTVFDIEAHGDDEDCVFPMTLEIDTSMIKLLRILNK